MQFDFDGEHDVDLGWMKEVRKAKIVPRFQFRGWTGEDLRAFIASAEESNLLAKEINDQANKYGFDGVVIECGYPAFFQKLLMTLSSLLHQNDKELIVVLPSLLSEQYRQIMTAEVFSTLAQYVDRFSLMTYDYSSHDPNGGPNAPIEWIMENIEYMTNEANRHKLMIGLNMYAMSYLPTRVPEPLVMKTVVEKLSMPRGDELLMTGDEVDENEELNWDKENQEAWFVDYDEDGVRQGVIWLPTLRSIRNRLRLAEDYGVGVALWEVGQGLDYFNIDVYFWKFFLFFFFLLLKHRMELDDYYNIDDILAEHTKVPCTVLYDFEKEANLSGDEVAVPRNTRVELPYWVAKPLAQYTNLIAIEIPRTYGTKVRNMLVASPESVDFRSLGAYFYEFGVKLVDFVVDEKLPGILEKAFKQRIKGIMNYSQSSGSTVGQDFIQKLDETEKDCKLKWDRLHKVVLNSFYTSV
ncbi:hypothetical protein RO3G_00916 [Rhizopus delemar RA 99-880]|uniref:Chitinase domain-containing protein 1 n=1 Tax=Rhizopus delemar (strain RA 99-880 / ATCC MYA-4621 / FGSC 9543 / NRRL 43880) TaxID=246409 RepID=I1BJ32_RHIO9|nr:hypothetical protein RO3G_00916 [Rhizopus delemar RA 99-880]|eukprot:EIE76212.1 hypothetical protein RO3G_00916 [Rhizopus delemar RA 99-880]